MSAAARTMISSHLRHMPSQVAAHNPVRGSNTTQMKTANRATQFAVFIAKNYATYAVAHIGSDSACGSMVLRIFCVQFFCAPCRKTAHQKQSSTALPKAKTANNLLAAGSAPKRKIVRDLFHHHIDIEWLW